MPEKIFLQTLKKQKTESIPFWYMRQAGRYLPEYRELRAQAGSFLKLCYTPEMAAEVTLQPIRRFGMSAAILFSDILVVPHALGNELTFVEGEGPKLATVRDEKDLARLELERVRAHVEPVCETLRLVKKLLPQETALIGFAGSPWTVACYMIEGGGSREFALARRMAEENEALFAALIDKVMQATLIYLIAQVEAGAEVIQLFDSWAGIASEEEFNKWIIAPTRALVSALKMRFPQLPIIGFPRAGGPNILPYAKETGVDAVSVDFSMPLEWVKKELQTITTVQGNLDPLLLAADGNRAIAQAKKIIAAWKDKPFIFNLGHGMVPHTPVAHVEELSAFLRTYRHHDLN